MAKPKRKKKATAGRGNPATVRARKRPGTKHRKRTRVMKGSKNPITKYRTKTVKIFAKRKNRRASNPFGVNMSAKQVGEIVAGAIIGGSATKIVAGEINNNVTAVSSSPYLGVGVNFAVAAALWGLTSRVKGLTDFAFGIGIGGLVVTADSLINAVAPQFQIPGGGLQGGRGVGDLVSAQNLLPWNPFTAGSTYSGSGLSAAYPQKYTRAA